VVFRPYFAEGLALPGRSLVEINKLYNNYHQFYNAAKHLCHIKMRHYVFDFQEKYFYK
jgi:hypothetical protein